ncbi:protein PRRC1-like [Saccostrea echinata]|uniref:protein PRRC1-like n=1 Tax=Saccostrea echinata TaxID=191078 RepID=UPI002A837596|nr:protein PRRC1-like [Saccostrea echinata]
MMEESSDESTEIISNEEAELAKKMQESAELSNLPTDTSTTKLIPSVTAPAPLPVFMSIPEASPSVTTQQKSKESSSPAPLPPQRKIPVSSPTSNVQQSNLTVKPNVAAPAQIETPWEASSHIPVPAEMIPESPTSPNNQRGGLFSWIGGSNLVNKVVEKTKSSMESMITTLDPGMKEVIRTGGDVYVVVASENENKVGAVREAFQAVFGKAIVRGMESNSTTAAQPVGYTCGLKGAEERIKNLREKGNLEEGQAIVSVEGFIVELFPDRWYEMSCLIIQDPANRVELQTFSQPTPLPAEYILQAQDRTPSDYPLRWAGLAVSIGQIVEESLPHVGHSDWQVALTGVSRRESLTLAAKTLAYMYKQRLPSAVV